MPDMNQESIMVNAVVPQGAGRYLTFRLGAESYGFEILGVREILSLRPITPLPQLPTHVRGVISLRDKVVPIIDLRLKLNLQNIQDTERTCIIVVQFKTSANGVPKEAGCIVDAVEEVITVAPADLESAPAVKAPAADGLILGMAKVCGRLKMILDIPRVLDAGSLRAFSPEPVPACLC
jgi:purine-binding chemotaxis protein CheW